MATQTAFDQAKAEQFVGRLLEAFNSASVISLASVGSRAGLFDAMAGKAPATVEQIARDAGLAERYVKEWLGGMVLGRVIDYDPTNQTYSLPAEHAAFLTAAAGPNNLTVLAQLFPYMGKVEDELVESFRNGGGVPYSSYPDFQRIQAENTRAYLDAALVEAVLPLAPGVTERLAAGGEALDIGTGAGHAVNLLAAAFPNSRFTGYDFAEDGVALGIDEAKSMGLTNARFAAKDIATVDEPGKYDLITAIELVHDLARPDKVLRAAYDNLKPDGTLLIVDMAASSNLEENYDHPVGATFFAFSVYHCMSVSLAQGGVGLGTMVGQQKVTQLLREAGFGSIEVKRLPEDFIYAYYVVRK